MPGRNRSGQLQLRPDPRGLPAPGVQQTPAPRRAVVGKPEPALLPVGANLLPEAHRQRPKPRLRPALPGPALAENPLSDVADAHLLRRRTPRPQPAQTRLMGAEPPKRQSLNMPCQ